VGIRTFRMEGELTDRRPIGDHEVAVVDGFTVCVPRHSAGDWFWVAHGDLMPSGPFPSARAALTDAHAS
jgi:hypothetical protein